ncbi:MAG TPA: Xaa-Pro peptidase family protein [Thermoanaerobaculia bacterium]|nr:Xaa-Pro peptidase family protein [Thermoanaerobaculia bacterium]
MPSRPLRAALALAFLLSTAAAIAQEGFPLFTTDFPPEEFAARRAKVYDAIGNQAFAVLQGAPSRPDYIRFRQNNDFYYLCGVEVPNAYLILDGASRKTTLLLPHRNEGRERGEGKTLSSEDADEVKKLTGVDNVVATDLIGEQIMGLQLRRGLRVLYTPLEAAENASMSRDLATRFIADTSADPFDGRPSREGAFVAKIHERFPVLEVKDLSPTLDSLRLIKSERELAMIRKATHLAGLAILEGMRSVKPGQYEHELDGVAKFVYWRNGAQGDAYFSLIGSGPNAFWPHYNAGKRKMLDGDFLLMDYAPDYGYYESDVTRMFPVNGRFSQWQRELYGFYLACYREILKAIAPGKTSGQVIQEAGAGMDRVLATAKFTKPSHRKAAEDWVAKYKKSGESEYPYLGHWVGMATHDDGPHVGPLRAGMVFTIEPALTVPDEKIYVRLEDVIFITDKGAEVVSNDAPWDIDAIEKVMKEDGMLKKYPRVYPAP